MATIRWNNFAGTLQYLGSGGGGGGITEIIAEDGNPTSGTTPSIIGASYGDFGVPVMDTYIDAGDLYVENRTWQTPYVVDINSTPGDRGTFNSIGGAIAQAVLDGYTNSGLGVTALILLRGQAFTENINIPSGALICLRGVTVAGTTSENAPATTIFGSVDSIGGGGYLCLENVGLYGQDNSPSLIISATAIGCDIVNCVIAQGQDGRSIQALGSASAVTIRNSLIQGTSSFEFNSFDTNAPCKVTNCLFQANIAVSADSWVSFTDCNLFPITLSDSGCVQIYNCWNLGQGQILNGSTDNANFNCEIHGLYGTYTSSGSNLIDFTGNLVYSNICVSGGAGLFGSNVTLLTALDTQGNYISSTYTAVNYTLLLTDVWLDVDTISLTHPITVTVPSNAKKGQVFYIKDLTGTANTYNITLSFQGGKTLDGLSSYVITTAYGGVAMKYDGSNFYSIAQLPGVTIRGQSGSVTAAIQNILPQQPSTGENILETYVSAGDLTIESNAWLTKYVVDPSALAGDKGTYATIQAAYDALNAAGIPNDFIFIRYGTYNENLVLNGIGATFVAFQGGSLAGAVIIDGHHTLSYTGTCNFQNLTLRSTTGIAISTSGSAVINANFVNCTFDATGFDSIAWANTNATSILNLSNCIANISATGGLRTFNFSGGSLQITGCQMVNTIGSTAQNIAGSCALFNVTDSMLRQAITINTVTSVLMSRTQINTSGTNQVGLNFLGAIAARIINSDILSGTATCMSVASPAIVALVSSNLQTSNATAISGTGTVNYELLAFSGAARAIVTSGTGGSVKGTDGTQPTAGFLGEPLTDSKVIGSAVAVPTGTPTNICTLALTLGIWDVSAVMGFDGVTTGISFDASISTVTATVGTLGQNRVMLSNTSNANNQQCVTLPPFRVQTTAGQNVFLVANANYSAGSGVAWGRLYAVRVG